MTDTKAPRRVVEFMFDVPLAKGLIRHLTGCLTLFGVVKVSGVGLQYSEIGHEPGTEWVLTGWHLMEGVAILAIGLFFIFQLGVMFWNARERVSSHSNHLQGFLWGF